MKLDLTENTPGSSSGVSRLPNLVEHAEICHQATAAVTGENLSSKLPNVVEGSMDYGSERRSSRYLEYEPKTTFQDGQTVSSNYGTGGEVGFANDGRPAYSSRSFDRKTPATTNYDQDNLDRYDNSRIYPEDGHLRYERRTERSYQESDLDAPYERTEATKLRGYTQDIQEGGRRYSRDLTDYEYAARYAEETLKLEPKKSDSSHPHHANSKIYEPVITAKGYDTIGSKGYDSGIKTRDSSYELGSFSNQQQQQQDIGGRKYESKYHSVGRMYGTLPRHESSTSKAYDSSYDTTGGGRSFDPKYDDSSYDVGTMGMKGSSTSKYDLTTSKSYERSKYEPVSRYQEPPASKSYEQTLKIGEMSTTGGPQQQGSSGYPRKLNQEARDSATGAAGTSEKTNGYRKNNFEAYGVYSDPEDDHGFLADKKAPQYTYKGVVVNVSGESTVVDQKRTKEARQTEVPRSPWCRPTILLLLLVLFVVIFVFVAGILLYFNCKYHSSLINHSSRVHSIRLPMSSF